MTGSPASVSVLALAGCLVCLGVLAAAGQVRAQPAGELDEAGIAMRSAIRFDIERQPLASALDRYGVATGLPVFFDSALAAGRISSAVHGVYLPAIALQRLLEGSGLVAGAAGAGQAGAFVLKAAGTPAAGGEVRDAAPQMTYRRYDGLVQTRIREAFCGNAGIVPGDYRIAVRFAIDAAGQVVNAFLLDSTGERARDSAVIDTLKQVRIDRPPPPDMAQPLTMVILPRALAPGMECPARR